MGKKQKKKKIVISVILSIAIIIGLIFIIYKTTRPDAIESIEMHLRVSNYTGFDVNTSSLIYGTVMPGASAKRTIAVKNLGDQDYNIKIVKKGELSIWTKVSEEKFMLPKGDSKNVDVSVNVPEDTELKEYNGTLLVIFT